MAHMAYKTAERPVRYSIQPFSPICLTSAEMDAWDDILASLCGETEPVGPRVFWEDSRHGVLWDIPPRSLHLDVYYY